jgi:hypothetical protein
MRKGGAFGHQPRPELSGSGKSHALVRSDEREVAHFSSRSHRSFSIQVQDGPRSFQTLGQIRLATHGCHLITDQIQHDGGTEEANLTKRQSTHRTYLLLELRHGADIQCVMPGIVRPWRHFVDQQSTVFHEEELDTKNAYSIES